MNNTTETTMRVIVLLALLGLIAGCEARLPQDSPNYNKLTRCEKGTESFSYYGRDLSAVYLPSLLVSVKDTEGYSRTFTTDTLTEWKCK